jgi:streptogramin lyase
MKFSYFFLAGLLLSLSMAASAQLTSPTGLAFDSSGHLWVANDQPDQVLEIDPSTGNVLNTITEGLNHPLRLFFGTDSILYVANGNGNNITAYNIQTLKLVRTVSAKSITFPLAVAADAYGDVYVGNNSLNNVVALNIGNGLVETLSQDKSGYRFVAPGAMAIRGANIYIGFGPGFGTDGVISYNVGEFLVGNAKEITFYNDNIDTGPTGIAFDGKGNVYISEFYSNTWVKYAPVGGSPLLVVSKGIAQPEGIAVDWNGNVFVANSTLANITEYNPAGKLIKTIH